MSNLNQQFEILLNKQLAFQDGIAMMEKAQMDFRSDSATADLWGKTAVFANAALIPLNVVINSFDLKGLSDGFNSATKFFYNQYKDKAASGTRISNKTVKYSLAIIKSQATKQLVAKKMGQYVPGVNILMGLAEDSVALIETALMVESGSQQMSILKINMENKIAQMKRQLSALGVESADVLGKMQRVANTA
jgi:hypothetical protein